MHIYIDADACPVTKTVISEAQQKHIQVTLVKSFNHFSHDQQGEGVHTIYVDSGSDAADYRITALVSRGDIVITQDFGLASLCLAKGCYVLHHKGFAYTNANIDRLLANRHASAKARRAGYKTKGPKAFTEEDEVAFKRLLIQTIASAEKAE
ncbi:YaiI/YqxD family protein [Lentibacillus saliphilus]|uniref:YaiI/YqxD family protein n=1 Tax=Lentibacillus saliphilus TaxID=2737028 RepID=UPI001C2F9BBE|nr:YaiI/YqxD family protein [Lentibacillus saliphilus]